MLDSCIFCDLPSILAVCLVNYVNEKGKAVEPKNSFSLSLSSIIFLGSLIYYFYSNRILNNFY